MPRPATELVFRYASTVGNYDYLVAGVFPSNLTWREDELVTIIGINKLLNMLMEMAIPQN